MSQEHKEALARGRQEARAIKTYLKAVKSRKPGRPVTKEGLEKRLARVEGKLREEQDPLKRVDLMQTKLNLQESLAKVEEAAGLDDFEAGFIQHAKSYSERKGITYTAWRRTGVPAEVLRKAGIPESRRR